MSAIDITPYLTVPPVNVAGGVSLGVAVITAVPEGSPPPVVRAAKVLREKTVALQHAWAATYSAEQSRVDRPAADHRVDIAWNAIFKRLDAYAELPADMYPKAGKAVALQGSIFDGGLRFLTLPYARQWAESDRHLRLIKESKAEPELRTLVGDDFVDEVKRAHEEYGAALRITETKQASDDVEGVQQPLRDLQAALRDYALQVVAAGNDGDGFTEAARAALAPIDRVRAAQHRDATAPQQGPAAEPLPQVTPTSPVPDVPGT